MDDQADLFATGLTQSQRGQLMKEAERAWSRPVTDLVADCRRYLESVRAQQKSNRLINIRLASAILSTFEELVELWVTLDENVQYWLSGAMQYFLTSEDDEPDFSSPIGFEDDAEVLNACLRMGGLDELFLQTEDYDGV